MDRLTVAASLVLAAAAAACSSTSSETPYMTSTLGDTNVTYMAPEKIVLDPSRKIVEQDCSKPVDLEHGNLRCK